ncbi:hypothetical protein E3G43_003277 [Mycobacteroides abscessus]|nr:hypothetical protein E3G43_003277 [Mycobacteroides abscessus]
MPADADRDNRDRAVRRDVDIGQRTRQVGAPVADGLRRLAGVAGVVPHEATNVFEVAVSGVLPSG